MLARLEKATANDKGIKLTSLEVVMLQHLIKRTFYSGMNYGYGVDHEKIHEDENRFWNEFKNRELFREA